MNPIDAYTLGQANGENGLDNNYDEMTTDTNKRMYFDGYLNGRARLISAVQSLIDRGEITVEWNSLSEYERLN